MTPPVECFNRNCDVIGHIMWQPGWKNGKILDLCFSETEPRKKVETCHLTSIPHGNKGDLFLFCHWCLLYDVIIADVDATFDQYESFGVSSRDKWSTENNW